MSALVLDLRSQCAEAFAGRNVVVEGDWRAWAAFNADVERRYRYVLGRFWADERATPVLVVGMCNPSKAGSYRIDSPSEEDNDPTIRKLIGFGKRLGCRGFLAVNAGAYIETDPTRLRLVADPIGPHNDHAIDWAFGAADAGMAIRVAAWGGMATGTRRVFEQSMNRMHMRGAVWCWGKTQGGEPRHPLMLAYATPLVHIASGASLPSTASEPSR